MHFSCIQNRIKVYFDREKFVTTNTKISKPKKKLTGESTNERKGMEKTSDTGYNTIVYCAALLCIL